MYNKQWDLSTEKFYNNRYKDLWLQEFEPQPYLTM